MAHAYEGQQTSNGRYLEQRRLLLYGMQGARYGKRQPPLSITSAINVARRHFTGDILYDHCEWPRPLENVSRGFGKR